MSHAARAALMGAEKLQTEELSPREPDALAQPGPAPLPKAATPRQGLFGEMSLSAGI